MGYVALGICVLGFNRSPIQVALTVGAALIFDVALHRVFRGGPLFPLSAAITGLSLSILVNYAHGLWFASGARLSRHRARSTCSRSAAAISTTRRCSASWRACCWRTA